MDLDAIDWATANRELDEAGVARLGPILDAAECDTLARAYDDDTLFRSKVVMARHGFGRGEYKYFRYPLADIIQTLRVEIYPMVAEIANRWSAVLGLDLRYPDTLDDMLRRCQEAGQSRPTPLLLSYGPGDFNCLHQDLYGDLVFPLQCVVMLSDRAAFEGGELVLTEQRPRMQSRAEVVSLAKGEAALFAVNERPRRGTRGVHRVKMRHGVSRVRSGQRRTLGIIFHDAA